MNSRRRLIVNADDFGRSRSINEAVIRAHREGILTSASLMMNEVACDEAVELARQNPKLGVGLHLTLLCGHSAISPSQIPGLVNQKGEFSEKPATTGLRYFVNRDLREQLRREIHEQFSRFAKTGLELDHVNGHLHMHMHPVVFTAPEGVTIETPTQTEILVKGADKQSVGQAAAKIRAFRPPEPYKGKGVRYAGEKIIMKEAKKA